MRFAQPTALWLLLLLPGIVILLHHGVKRRGAFLRRFADPALLRQIPSRFPRLQNAWLLTLLAVLPFVCTALALGDPRHLLSASRLQAETLDVVMLLDVSKSMAAEDYGANSRLDQARQMAQQLLSQLRGNRVGLVTYAGMSFRQAELTEDLVALDFILKHWLNVNAVGVGGSDLVQALDTGLALFQEDDIGRDKLLLLFSDGGSQDDAMRAVLTKATQAGVRVVTLGLGSLQPSRIPQYNAEREFVDYLQVDGQVVTTRLNEDVLRHIADATHGTYVHITRGNEWHDLLSRPAVVGNALAHDERKLFQPFLLFGLLAFGAHALITRL